MKSARLLFTVLCATALMAQSTPRVSAKQSQADAAKGTLQGSWRQSKLPKLEFSPVLPQFFYTVPTYATGGLVAESVVARDLNGDGKLDLVIGNGCSDSTCTAGSAAVLLGNGDGTFQPAVNYKAGYTASTVAVADVNGDGKLDIVAANNCTDSSCAAGSVTALLGNGDGTFQAGVTYAAGYRVVSVAIGDVNADGKPDLIATNGCADSNCTGGSVTVLLGNGDGTFKAGVSYAVTGLSASSVAIGDVNGDGKPDLVVSVDCSDSSCINGSVAVLLGNGDGTFKTAVSYLSGGFQTFAVAIADVNGDGKPDVIAVNDCFVGGCAFSTASGSVGVLLGNGDGTFQAATTYSSGGYGGTSVVVVDVNGDGKADLVVGNDCTLSDNCSSSNVAVLLSNGDGTFQPPVSYDSGATFATSVAAGDLNGDGKTDLLVVNDCEDTACDGAVAVLLGSGNGKFPSATSYGPGGSVTNALAVADLNGDGNPDIVTANQCTSAIECNDTTVGVLLGKSDGTFQTAVSYGSGGYDATSVVIADVNGDGKPDIIVANSCTSRSVCSASTIGVLLGNGDGTFRTAVSYRSGTNTVSIAVGDINGDGKPDIVLSYLGADDNGGVGVMLGKGNGTFGSMVKFGSGGLNQVSVAIADVNQDGKPDILVTNLCGTDVGINCVSGTVGVLLGNGDGTFQAAVVYNTGGIQAYSVAVGDMNKDGKPDLVVENIFASQTDTTNGTIGVLLGNGDGTFQSVISSPTVSEVSQIAGTKLALADFDGDGKLDAAAGGSHTLVLGNGDGTFQAPIQIPGGGPAIAVGDFNHDGSPDLAVNGVTVLLNLSGGSATAVVSPPSINFGNQTVGTTSASQTVTLSNTGTATLNLSSIGVSASNGSVVIQTNNCGTSVAAGASCAVTVAWTPNTAGSMTGSLTFTDNAVNSPQVVSLSGVGVSTTTVSFSPPKLVFNTQVVFTTSPALTATLTNTGSGTLSISRISLTGPFSQTNNCGTSVVGGGSCTFTVTFRPTTIGTLKGTILVTDNASNSPQLLALTGFGTYLKFNPTSLTFGNQSVGTKSPAQRIMMINKGSVAVNITSFAIVGTDSGDFAETNNCGSSLGVGASCMITVTFTPLATGSRNAAVWVTDDGGGSPQKIAVTGTGT